MLKMTGSLDITMSHLESERHHPAPSLDLSFREERCENENPAYSFGLAYVSRCEWRSSALRCTGESNVLKRCRLHDSTGVTCVLHLLNLASKIPNDNKRLATFPKW
jgi:hypothetical protein